MCVFRGTITYLPFIPLHSVNVKWVVKLPPLKIAVTHKLITVTTIITNSLYHTSLQKKKLAYRNYASERSDVLPENQSLLQVLLQTSHVNFMTLMKP